MLSKRQGTDRVEVFQLISLFNSIYLIIAKVLANRVQGVIGELVEPFQSAFIWGRLLVDSVVVAGEIIASWQGRMDLSTKGCEAGMPIWPPIICFGSRHTCQMHYASVFTRSVERISNTKLSRWHSFAAICRQHHVF